MFPRRQCTNAVDVSSLCDSSLGAILQLGFLLAHGALLRMTRSAFLGLLVATTLATVTLAQVGHPAKGSWSGYWGTSDASKRRILLVLDWRDRQITGVINPGPNQVPIDKADLDVDTWTLRLRLPCRRAAAAKLLSSRPASSPISARGRRGHIRARTCSGAETAGSL
jgi:hypothetical protein